MAWTSAKEEKKEEIESRLKTIGGDMLRMEYLENCLKKGLSFDVRKFVLFNLSALYGERRMYGEAAKHMNAAAEIAATFREKRDLYMRTVELFIKHASYYEAEDAFKKAIACSNSQEKIELKQKLKLAYKEKARELESMQRLNNAIKIYEKMLVDNILEGSERIEAVRKLASFCNKLGKVFDENRYRM